MSTIHIPILVNPIIEALVEPFLRLSPDSPPHYILDCTLGGGGHTSAFLSALAARPELQKHRVISVDQDQAAIQAAQERFQKEISEGKLTVFHRRFSGTSDLFDSFPILGLMADLGFSSDQIEDPQRGLSFQEEGPLDMRLDPTRGLSCREFLNTITEEELEKVLREYGEERFSKRIASAIVSQRRSGNAPKTTQELVGVVVRAIPASARHGRIHAATRTFQALRIAVNEELSELDNLLDQIIPKVKLGGRVALLSFHSLEDRRVKVRFKKDSSFHSLTKKPIQADEDEMKRNPRARSAKLRIAERC